MVIVSAVLVATACSSGSKTSSPPSTAATSVLGTPKAATGTPVTIGFITDGRGQTIDDSSDVPAAQAAVDYANDYLGGIAGHPIKLAVCDDNQTPSGTTDCDNQMIADKVPIVLNDVTANAEPLIDGLKAAGIPLMLFGTSDSTTLSSNLAYVLTNGLAADFAAPAEIGKLAGAKRAAVFVIDVPGASGPVKQLSPVIFKNAGIDTVDVVPIAPGTADMTPQVQAELTKNPGVVQVFGDVTFCTSALKALKTLGYSKPIVLIAQCIDASSAASIPGGYSGMQLATNYTTSTSDPDVKIYMAAMARYSPATAPFTNGVTQGGFEVVLGLVRGLSTLTGSVTTANIQSTLASMPPTLLPFGGGATFQCNRKQISITPAVCSTGALAATLNQSGQPQGSFMPLNVGNLLQLG
jgi:branched-chain amino acid transport system substrate-binding protein